MPPVDVADALQRVAGCVAAAVLSAGAGLAGSGFGAGMANAGPYEARQWCPGDDPRGEPGGAFVTSPPVETGPCVTPIASVAWGQDNVHPGILADAPAASTADGVLVAVPPQAVLAVFGLRYKEFQGVFSQAWTIAECTVTAVWRHFLTYYGFGSQAYPSPSRSSLLAYPSSPCWML